MDEVKLALEMSKLVHDKCKDVPHDIGLRLLEIVKRNMNEQLRKHAVVGRSEQLKASFQVGEKVLLDDHTEVEVLVAEPKLYIRQNEFDSEMWVNTERLKKKSNTCR